MLNFDLRGHGESDSPEQTYSVEQFAEDVAWILQRLDVEQAVLVGLSMGGVVALDAAYRFPGLIKAVALIDTVFEMPAKQLEILAPLLPGFHNENYEQAFREIMCALSLSSDRAELDSLLGTLPKAPRHVLLSTLQQHLEFTIWHVQLRGALPRWLTFRRHAH